MQHIIFPAHTHIQLKHSKCNFYPEQNTKPENSSISVHIKKQLLVPFFPLSLSLFCLSFISDGSEEKSSGCLQQKIGNWMKKISVALLTQNLFPHESVSCLRFYLRVGFLLDAQFLVIVALDKCNKLTFVHEMHN